MVELLFPGGAPPLREYARENAVAPSTFRRAAKWVLGPLRRLLEERKPGPEPTQDREVARREEALEKLRDLRAWIRENRSPTGHNDCYSPEAKKRVAAVAEELSGEGVLSYAEVAEVLGMDERQLRRIRKQVEEAGGEAPRPESRRPKETHELAEEIQLLIARIVASGDSRKPYTAADVRRILEKKYKRSLREYHGSETISEDTVRKYMPTPGKDEKKKDDEREHKRGRYHYPEPFEEVAIDTAHFKLFGLTFYFITVFEFAGRLNLTTKVFLADNTAAVVEVLEGYLERFPGVGVVVIDRGTPYLNEEVWNLLDSNGRVRLVSPTAEPTAKAAAERHFRTLKEVIRPAIEKVFPEDPGWSPGKLAKLLEMGVSVFADLYHQIPQEGIDGKSPAERIESFDPVRAAESLVELFARAERLEPSEDYAREIHRLFGLPGSEEKTVSDLRSFSRPTLEAAVKEISSRMGPGFAKKLKDPLGFIGYKARMISLQKQEAYARKRLEELKTERRREEERTRGEESERQKSEREEHPERFVEPMLASVARCVESGFEGGLKIALEHLKELLRALRKHLGSAFTSEVRRLRERLGGLTEKPFAQVRTAALLEEIAREVLSEEGGC
ncbi:MAG: hypothetical protein ACE5F1_11415 [Planctomycetota bacterium]